MGKLFLVVVGIAIGYGIGYGDARKHPNHVVVRGVEKVRTIFGGKSANDIDAVMTKVEGKN